MASEVEEADGAEAAGTAAAGCCEGGCGDEEELTLLAALEVVPLVAALLAPTPLGVRVVVELVWLVACWLMLVLLLDLRVLPTSLRKREFMDDDIQKVAFLAEQANGGRRGRRRAEWGVRAELGGRRCDRSRTVGRPAAEIDAVRLD